MTAQLPNSLSDGTGAAGSAENPPTGQQEKAPLRRTRLLLLVLGAVVVATYVVGFMVSGDRVPRQAQISGVAVGGLDRASAITKLQRELVPRSEQSIAVVLADRKDQVSPSTAGLAVDIPASVDLAGAGRSFRPDRIWQKLTGGSATEAVKIVEPAKLASTVADLAVTHNRAPSNADLAYVVTGGTPAVQVTRAQEGLQVRQAETAEALTRAFLTADPAVELPADRMAPAITDDEAEQLRTQFAIPAISGPVTVRVQQAGQLQVTPTMVARAVSFDVRDGALVPDVDPQVLRKAIDKSLDALQLDEPRDATVRIDDGRPVVVPARNGTELSADTLADAVLPALTKPKGERLCRSS